MQRGLILWISLVHVMGALALEDVGVLSSQCNRCRLGIQMCRGVGVVGGCLGWGVNDLR